MTLCLFSASAQDTATKKKLTLLLDLAQPAIGQVQVGVLLPVKPNFDILILGRYNYNYVPNRLAFSYYGSNIPVFEYSIFGAQESGFTLGAQARFSPSRTANKPYEEYLKSKPKRAMGYMGGWMELGKSISKATQTSVYYPSIEGSIPQSQLSWSNVMGGALFGFKADLTQRLLVDVYTGIGLRYLKGEFLQSGVKRDPDTGSASYNGAMDRSSTENTMVMGRLGIQIGYTF